LGLNLTNLKNYYSLPDLFDGNNDTIYINILVLPHFVIFNNELNELDYSFESITPLDYANYTIEITL